MLKSRKKKSPKRVLALPDVGYNLLPHQTTPYQKEH